MSVRDASVNGLIFGSSITEALETKEPCNVVGEYVEPKFD